MSKACGTGCLTEVTDRCSDGQCVDLFGNPTGCSPASNTCGSDFCSPDESCKSDKCVNNNACGSSICQQGESCKNGECWNDSACGSRTNICSYSQLCLDGTTCVEDSCVNRQAVGCPCSLGDNPIGKWSCSHYGGTYSYGCTVSANGCSCQAGDCRGQCGCGSVPPPPYPTPPPVSTPATPRCEITSKKCGNACTATATDECQNGECVDLFKRPTPCGTANTIQPHGTALLRT